MEFEPEELQVIELLTKLRNQGGTYPRKLLASRRQVFLSQMASVGLGLGIGTGLKTVAKTPRGGGLFHLSSISASSLLEMVLLLAIVTQASIIAYSYRDAIADYINTLSYPSTPTVLQVPITGSSPTDVVASETPTATTTETVTASPSSTVTTVPSILGDENSNDINDNTSPAVMPQATNDNGNNGNHYGQTPKPPQPKDDPKPTKGGGGGKKP